MTFLDFTQLTRRPDPHQPDTWLVYCGDICAGQIAKSVGRPNAQNEWTWRAGFYPGSRPGEIKGGTADSFEDAKAKFERAWLEFASSRKSKDFETWRAERSWTAWKYRMRDEGLPMPAQSENGRAKCFCGAEITQLLLWPRISRPRTMRSAHEADQIIPTVCRS